MSPSMPLSDFIIEEDRMFLSTVRLHTHPELLQVSMMTPACPIYARAGEIGMEEFRQLHTSSRPFVARTVAK